MVLNRAVCIRISFFFILVPVLVFGQKITHGPVVGGLTDSSARIYVRTVEPMPGNLVLSGSGQTLSWEFNTTAERDNSTIIDLANLEAASQHFQNPGRQEIMFL
jgi:hypothetical protein